MQSFGWFPREALTISTRVISTRVDNLRGKAGLTSKVIETDFQILNAQQREWIEDGIRHHRKTAEVVHDVLGSVMLLVVGAAHFRSNESQISRRLLVFSSIFTIADTRYLTTNESEEVNSTMLLTTPEHISVVSSTIVAITSSKMPSVASFELWTHALRKRCLR